jgi:hypothetical protein
MVTIEEHFGVIQKLLVPGFETKIGNLTPWAQRPMRMLAASRYKAGRKAIFSVSVSVSFIA